MDNLSGQQIKGYELRERIGTGGFGAVYKAQQSTVNREVAIKIILPHFSNHPDFIRRFENEAQLVARLEHLHIVPLYDYWRDPDGAYLVMRWLRGGSLRDALQKGSFTSELAVTLIDQLATALAAAHRSNIIHRDLKPGNILLDEDGNAYLADFGIAKDIGLKGSMTEPDAIVESPDYLAPEQARGEIVTPATDIYSLGVVLYEILTGEHPFPNLTSVERLYKHLNEPLPTITNLPDAMRSGMNNVVQKATAKNPADRYSDVLDMAVAFRSAARTQNTGNLVEVLTLREQEILRLIVNGRSNKEIAEELFIAVNTVKWYATQIYQKLGVRTRVQAIIRARELNLIRPNPSGTDIILDTKTVIPTDEFQPPNPYKGLRSFQAADNQDFFGREKLIEKLIKRMSEVSLKRITSTPAPESEMGRFLAVVGPSGSGKSSLVKAGLVPALWRGDLPGSEKWFIVDMLPGSHPLDELEIALTRVAANQSGNLRDQLERDERGLVRASQLILPNDGTELVVIIDQFEEVFTLVTDEQERIQFLKLIQSAVSDPRSRVRIVVTLRADFYDRPLHYAGMGELFRSRIETILPLTTEGLDRAISQPAEQVGVRFEAGLVAKIISEVNYQPGALPLLQYALTELFELRKGRLLTLEAYQSIGGTVGALAKRVDDLYRSMSVVGQEAARQMFLRLVTLGEGFEDTRRRVPRSVLLAVTTEPDIMDEVIDTFATYRLLSLDNDPSTRTPTVEVAHEAILREWERLRSWLNDSRDDIKLQRQLANSADEWQQSGREPSFLLRGSRLTTLAKWSSETNLALTEKERHYLQESLSEQQQLQAAETERQARVKALEQRAVRTLRVLVVVLLLATLGALGLSGYAVTNANEAQAARQVSETNLQRSESLRLAAAANTLLPGNTLDAETAALLSIQSLRVQYSPEADNALTQAVRSLFTVRYFPMGEGINAYATLSPDKTLLATSTPQFDIQIWDTTKWIVLQTLKGHIALISDLNWSPNGKLLWSSSQDGTSRIWDLQTGLTKRQFKGGFFSLATISTDNHFVAAQSSDFVPTLFDIISGQLVSIPHIDDFTAEISIQFSSYGPELIATGLSGKSNSYISRMINLETGEIVREFPCRYGLTFSQNGTRMACADPSTFKVFFWDATNWTLLHTVQGTAESDMAPIAISADGTITAISNANAQITLWDTNSGQRISTLIGNTGQIRFSGAFIKNNTQFLSASKDGILRLWDIQSGIELRRIPQKDLISWGPIDILRGEKLALVNSIDDARLVNIDMQSEPRTFNTSSIVWRVSYSPDGSLILIGTSGVVYLWDVVHDREVRHFSVPENTKTGVASAVFSPDAKMILTGGNLEADVRLWNTDTGALIRILPGPITGWDDVSFSPDGRYVAAGNDLREAYVWNTQTGKMIYDFNDHTDAVYTVRFSPNSKLLVTATLNGFIKVWDLLSGKLVRTIKTGQQVYPNWSPDSQNLVTASDDIEIWNIDKGEMIHKYDQHGVYNAVFSKDSQQIISANTNGALTVIDINTGNVIRSSKLTNSFIGTLDVSPDGRYIVAGSWDSKAYITSVRIEDVIDYACTRIFRELTTNERKTYLIPGNSPTCPQFGSPTVVPTLGANTNSASP